MATVKKRQTISFFKWFLVKLVQSFDEILVNHTIEK